jgi:hypothetical protein
MQQNQSITRSSTRALVRGCWGCFNADIVLSDALELARHVTRRVRDPLGLLEIREREHDEPPRARADALDPGLPFVLRRFACGPSREAPLRALLGARATFASTFRLTEEEVIAEIARLVRRGDLRIERREIGPLPTFADEGRAEDAPPLAPPTSETIATWIEIELVESDGKPVGGEPYQVIADDGRVIEGSLDGRGFARVEGVTSSTCTVVFPKRDRTDWDGEPLVVPEEGAEPPARTWIEIELVDEEGEAVKDEPFIVYQGDREVARGRLSAEGRARVDGLPVGACAVSFPWRHAFDVELAS